MWGKQRPAPPQGAVVPHPLKYAGKPAEDKLKDLQALLKKDGQDAVVLTFPDSICWLFNIRGSDVAHNPVALAFAVVPASGKPELFVDAAKIGPEAKAHLAPLAKISEPAALERRLVALKEAGKIVRISPAAPLWFTRKLKGGKARVVRATDPCLLPKARKNATEIKGTRAAHKRDGAAVARFLAWLDGQAETGRLDEIVAAQKLETIRSETQALKEISFDTISGSGPNGAIVHYRVTTATNRKLKSGELYLVDSGAQYLDGTTDVTRTVAIGTPTREMQERFTLVLKGHIAIATARFPKGTRGIDLDPFARRALWEAGLDFDHGTGHGVGSYLSVHEGPQSISKGGMVALEPGMIISNEPGYYKTGAYGIRIENLVLVSEPAKVAGGERETMSFETLTLVPIDRRLVVAEMLSPAELDWLNAYHRRVREIIGPELGPADREWLETSDGGDPDAGCHPGNRAAGVRAAGASELPMIMNWTPRSSWSGLSRPSSHRHARSRVEMDLGTSPRMTLATHLELQHPLQERQLGFEHGDDRLGLAEAVALAGELAIFDVDAALFQFVDDEA